MEIDLNVKETRRLRFSTGLLCGLFAMSVAASTDDESNVGPLEPEPRHENIGELVTTFIQKSHYNHVAVNDDLSSRVMDRYMEELDRNRMYLLASDVEFFEEYRYELDDIVRNEPLDPVFDMFSVYRSRVRERFQYASIAVL